MLKLLLSTNQIFRQEKARKTLTLFYYKIIITSHQRTTLAVACVDSASELLYVLRLKAAAYVPGESLNIAL